MNQVRGLICGAIAAVTISCGLARADSELDHLLERWKSIFQEIDGPGLALTVVKDGEVVLLEGIGHRNVARSDPVTPDTVFYIASSTKSYVAMAIMQLAEQGKVELDAPVKKYLPRFKLIGEDATKSVTIRQLLSHEAGLIGDTIITVREAYTGTMNEDDYYRLLAKYVSATGKFGYSNLHYTLLGRVIESVSGKGWKLYVQDHIFDPAGMNRSFTSADTMYTLQDVAIPMNRTKGRVWVDEPTKKSDSTMHAAGGIGTSARDLSRWLRLNMEGGSIDGERILSSKLIAEMQSPQAEANTSFAVYTREHYGLGWYIGGYEGDTLVHHFGGFLGARAHVSFMPEHGVGVAIVVNSTDPASYAFAEVIAMDVYDYYVGREESPSDSLLTKVRALAARDPSEGWSVPRPERSNNPAVTGELSLAAAAYTGVYNHKEWGDIKFLLRDGQLLSTWGNLNPGIVAQDEDSFFFFRMTDRAVGGRFIIESGRVTGIALALALDGGDEVFDRR